MERCPSCRGRLNESALCPRCGCDLGLVLSVESRAENLVRLAIRAWADGNPKLAQAHVDKSLALKRGTLAETLAPMLRKIARGECRADATATPDQGIGSAGHHAILDQEM